MYYRNVPGKDPCTAFQVAASIQKYAIYVLGKSPCGPKSRVMFKRPWALTQDTTHAQIIAILPFQVAVPAEPVELVAAAAVVAVVAILFSVVEHCSRPASKH